MEKFLTDVCDITTGKLDSNAAVDNGRYPFFTCAPQPLQIDNYEFDEDAILLARNNAQGNFHINRYNGKFNAYQRTYVITAKTGYDIDYIKYAIEMSLSHLKKIAQGSQTKFLTMTMLNDFRVEDRDYAEQCELIASVKAIDNKISINNTINDNLQQQMCLIYEYMMYQVKTKELDGSHTTVSELSEVITGKEDANFSIPNGKYNFFTCSNDTLKCDEYSFDSSSILIAGNGTFNVKHFSGKFNAYQRTYILTPQKEYYALLYLASLYRVNAFKSTSAGSIIKFITKNDIENIPVFIPNDADLLTQLNKLVAMQEKNISENEELTALRDWLLPMLMNGQATISD